MEMGLLASGFGQIGWDLNDVFRVVIALLAMILIGANISFIIHARKIFYRKTVNFWIMFFLAKSFITFSVALAAWERAYAGQPILIHTWIAGAGIVLSNFALLMLWKNREELPTEEELTKET